MCTAKAYRRSVLGFKDIKKLAIQKIKEGSIQHEPREFGKNFYAQGEITDEEVIEIFKNCKGDQYSTDKHHLIKSISVHVIKAIGKYDGLYVKFYFIEPDIWFISVHT